MSHCKLFQGSKSSASQISTRSLPSRNCGFGVHGQGEVATNHGGHDEVMVITDDLSVGIAVGTAQGAFRLSPPPRRGAVQGEAQETAALESLVAFGTMEHRGQSGPRGCRIQTFGEVTQGIIAEGLADG
ncbi:MAG: hypothetical protein DMG32_20010 [Acidobacteria bacterium]|nr:MAG: hypothetical protein DMG32_20010 [Acidobacteriota bacterium]